jgi:uncharacterized protein (TIGR03663 family)
LKSYETESHSVPETEAVEHNSALKPDEALPLPEQGELHEEEEEGKQGESREEEEEGKQGESHGDREDAKQVEQPKSSVPSWLTREQIFNWSWSPFVGVFLLGAILRFWGLGDKPLHHDESLHAYFSMKLLQNDLQDWFSCLTGQNSGCYHYDPLLHGPFQFHAIALVYQLSQWLGLPDHGINTFTVRIAAATLGSLIVFLPFFLRDQLGTIGAWLACLLLAVSPSMVYFSRFAREDIYMACFTLLLVVAVARYLRVRKLRWLVIAFAAFALSYATKEATFLTVGVFGSFLGALIFWELGSRISFPSRYTEEEQKRRFIPKTGASLAVLLYLLVAGLVAKWAFAWIKDLSLYITNPRNTNVANAYVQNLKDQTLLLIPWLIILFGILILAILVREMQGKSGWPERLHIARFFDSEKQPLLYTLSSIPWLHLFLSLLVGLLIFVTLFSSLFTSLRTGIGDGIWQGLYYWLQQQQVARGGQPWYYYLMLIPLYEQIGLVFGLVGVVRALLQPTRFRLFLAYWFVGNVFIYSWAAEKMPWLMIHMTMPMLLLAALGLEPAVSYIVSLVQRKQTSIAVVPSVDGALIFSHLSVNRRHPRFLAATSVATIVLALLLLLPTLQNMREVTFVHPADAPHEMMIYVQTTTDINTVMSKVEQVDQKLTGGKQQIVIGVTEDALWPYAWYLRDYPNVCWDFPNGCVATANQVPLIITGGDQLYSTINQYASATGPDLYNVHQYHLRTWWDEGYKPAPCVVSTINTCNGEPVWGGVGPLLWLSYGDTPPAHATFNFPLAVQHIWQWWWERKPFGSTAGSYDMGLFIRKNLDVAP